MPVINIIFNKMQKVKVKAQNEKDYYEHVQYMANYQKDYILNDFVTTNQVNYIFCNNTQEKLLIACISLLVYMYKHMYTKQVQMSSPTNTKGNNFLVVSNFKIVIMDLYCGNHYMETL